MTTISGTPSLMSIGTSDGSITAMIDQSFTNEFKIKVCASNLLS